MAEAMVIGRIRGASWRREKKKKNKEKEKKEQVSGRKKIKGSDFYLFLFFALGF